MKTIYTSYDVDNKVEVQVKDPFWRKIFNFKSPSSKGVYAVKVIYGEGKSKRKLRYPKFPKMIEQKELVGIFSEKDLGISEKIISDIRGTCKYFNCDKSELMDIIRRKTKHNIYLSELHNKKFSIKELQEQEDSLISEIEEHSRRIKNLKEICKRDEVRAKELREKIERLKLRLKIEKYKSEKITERDREYFRFLSDLVPLPSEKEPKDKIIGGSVPHHAPNGYKGFIKRISEIDVVESVRCVRTSKKPISGLKQPGGNIFEAYYTDGSMSAIIEITTTGENEIQNCLAKEELKERLGI